MFKYLSNRTKCGIIAVGLATTFALVSTKIATDVGCVAGHEGACKALKSMEWSIR